MKFLCLPLLLLICLTSFAQSGLSTDSVYISGRINHFERYKDSANSVAFYINDIFSGEQITHRAKVNADGIFKTTFIKTGTQDIYIEYNDNLETIIVSPGDRMQLVFDGENLGKTLSFKGDNAQTNTDLKAYEAAFDMESQRIYGTEPSARAMKNATSIRDLKTGGDYTRYRTEQFKHDNDFLRGFIAEHLPSPVFVKWAQTDIDYSYVWDLMRYPWLHPRYAKLKEGSFTVPDAYYNFVKDFPVDDPDLAISSNYGGYMDEYRNYTATKSLGKGYKAADALALFARRPAGFSRDVLLSLQYAKLIGNHELPLAKASLKLIKKKVSDEVIRSRMLAAYKKAVGSIRDSVRITRGNDADSLFSSLISKYRNKVIYVDFWATWCSPCRAEMPYSKALRSQFAGKDVVFLYLGVQSTEKAWKDMIASLDIRGENVLLSRNEFNALAEKFQISGIPRYLLVNKKGQVVDDNARRPGDKAVKLQIQKLLAL